MISLSKRRCVFYLELLVCSLEKLDLFSVFLLFNLSLFLSSLLCLLTLRLQFVHLSLEFHLLRVKLLYLQCACTYEYNTTINLRQFISSTPPSRPNNVRLSVNNVF